MPGMVLFWELRSVGGAAWRAVGVCLSLFLPLPVQAEEGGGAGRCRHLLPVVCFGCGWRCVGCFRLATGLGTRLGRCRWLRVAVGEEC